MLLVGFWEMGGGSLISMLHHRVSPWPWSLQFRKTFLKFHSKTAWRCSPKQLTEMGRRRPEIPNWFGRKSSLAANLASGRLKRVNQLDLCVKGINNVFSNQFGDLYFIVLSHLMVLLKQVPNYFICFKRHCFAVKLLWITKLRVSSFLMNCPFWAYLSLNRLLI